VFIACPKYTKTNLRASGISKFLFFIGVIPHDPLERRRGRRVEYGEWDGREGREEKEGRIWPAKI
jgi:hypothetical protein